MQLIVQVNSQRENQSESMAIIKKNKTKQNKTKQKVADPQKKSAACMRDFGLC